MFGWPSPVGPVEPVDPVEPVEPVDPVEPELSAGPGLAAAGAAVAKPPVPPLDPLPLLPLPLLDRSPPDHRRCSWRDAKQGFPSACTAVGTPRADTPRGGSWTRRARPSIPAGDVRHVGDVPVGICGARAPEREGPHHRRLALGHVALWPRPATCRRCRARRRGGRDASPPRTTWIDRCSECRRRPPWRRSHS